MYMIIRILENYTASFYLSLLNNELQDLVTGMIRVYLQNMFGFVKNMRLF